MRRWFACLLGSVIVMVSVGVTASSAHADAGTMTVHGPSRLGFDTDPVEFSADFNRAGNTPLHNARFGVELFDSRDLRLGAWPQDVALEYQNAAGKWQPVTERGFADPPPESGPPLLLDTARTTTATHLNAKFRLRLPRGATFGPPRIVMTVELLPMDDYARTRVIGSPYASGTRTITVDFPKVTLPPSGPLRAGHPLELPATLHNTTRAPLTTDRFIVALYGGTHPGEFQSLALEDGDLAAEYRGPAGWQPITLTLVRDAEFPSLTGVWTVPTTTVPAGADLHLTIRVTLLTTRLTGNYVEVTVDWPAEVGGRGSTWLAVNEGTPSPTHSPPAGAPAASGGGALPTTGVNTAFLALCGGLLVTAGATLSLTIRRRRS
ncbi:MAG: hypothetical protein ACJ73S_10520 [Mycobacteriales bacterium]